MILHLFLGLISIALLFYLVGQEKRRRIWSILLFGAVLALIYTFLRQINTFGLDNVIYSWIPHRTLKASLSFTSQGPAAMSIRIISLCLVAAIYLNIIYRRETFSLQANNLILLNLAALIVLLSAQDFIQLMIGSCCFSIIGFYLINDVEAKSKFIFYNFLAELAIFSSLAIVYAHLDTITLSGLSKYARLGRHKDLIALLLLGGIFIKCGMFLAQNQMIALKSLSFSRVIVIALFSVPLSGFILFAKLFPIIEASSCAHTVFMAILPLSALWAIGGSWLIDNLKAKLLYTAMLFNTYVLWQMWGHPEVFLEKIVYLYPSLMLVYCSWLFAGVSAEDKVLLSRFGNLKRKLWFNLLLSLLSSGALIGALLKWGDSSLFMVLFCLPLALVIHGIYLGSTSSEDISVVKNIGLLYSLPYILAIAFLSYCFKLYRQTDFWFWWSGFILVTLLIPAKPLLYFAAKEHLQESDILHRVYKAVLIKPLRMIGRVLWLAIDFVVIERSIIGTLAQTTRFIGRSLQAVQTASWWHYFLLFTLGIVIILFNLGWSYYE